MEEKGVMEDFIGFTYNGKHSINDYKIYRTSNGSRYDDNLVPPINDKTADVPGGDGQYFFDTNYKNRQFSISIAFDSLTEEKYREMRSWLDGKEIHDLIFDEAPYKVYSAKVTGTPQLKTLCFDQDGHRVYKGEGTIQFTCYYPYAHTPNDDGMFLPSGEIIKDSALKLNMDYPCLLYFEQYLEIPEGYTVKIVWIDLISGITYSKQLPQKIEGKDYYSQGFGKNRKLCLKNLNILQKPKEGDFWLKLQFDNGSNKYYKVTTNNCLERVSSIDTDELLPKNRLIIDDYSHQLYPNKIEWMLSSGLGNQFNNGNNYGDIPAHFEVSGTLFKTNEERTINVGNCEIIIEPHPDEDYSFYWNSKNGFVGKKGLGTILTPIPYRGKSYGVLPVGENLLSGLDGLTLKYNYWYY